MKKRIDIILVERGLSESRTKSQWLIKNGFVFVNEKIVLKPGKRIENSLEIQLKQSFPYVGIGGLKLKAALNNFSISVDGRICMDIGASVGGFTDCLIKHGALKVYAIDIAPNFLHPSLKTGNLRDKIIPLFGIDARNAINIKEKIDICSIDVTFASLKTILPNVKSILKKNGDIIALVKPIFETEFLSQDKFKIIKEPQQFYQILIDLINWNKINQIFPYGIFKSPILGKGGSLEFFIHFKIGQISSNFRTKKLIEEILSRVIFNEV